MPTRKRKSQAVPVLSAAGLLALTGGATAQMIGHRIDLPTRGTDVSAGVTSSRRNSAS